MKATPALGLALASVVLFAPAAVRADGTLTAEDLKGLLEIKESQEEMVRLVKEADSLQITREDLARLRQWGAKAALLAEIEKRVGQTGGKLTLDRVIRMAGEGLAEAEMVGQILASGESFTLTTADKLRLVRAKVGKDVILALEGKYVFPGFRSYRDPMGTFAIQYPEPWRAYHWYTADGLKILLSPEAGVKKANEFTTGLLYDAAPPPHASKPVGLLGWQGAGGGFQRGEVFGSLLV